MENPKKERILKMFGEYALFKDEREREEAASYLNSWKKYLVRRLQRDTYHVKVIEEQWGEVPPNMNNILAQYPIIYLKIIIEFEWKYSDDYDKIEGVTVTEKNLKPKQP